jgi:hypothetical protein
MSKEELLKILIAYGKEMYAEGYICGSSGMDSTLYHIMCAEDFLKQYSAENTLT